MTHAALYVPAAGGGAVDELLLETGDKLLLETGAAAVLNEVDNQTTASALDGTEWTVIVQGGTTKKIAIADLSAWVA